MSIGTNLIEILPYAIINSWEMQLNFFSFQNCDGFKFLNGYFTRWHLQ